MPVQAVAGLDAIATAISGGADPPPQLASPRFYRDGEVPEDAPLGYYLLGAVLEDPAGFYHQPGASAVYRVHCWAETHTQALRLYAWLHDLLHGSRLPVASHTVWECRVRLIGNGRDATSEARQALAEVSMETVAI